VRKLSEQCESRRRSRDQRQQNQGYFVPHR
jgi:hypothetical protein